MTGGRPDHVYILASDFFPMRGEVCPPELMGTTIHVEQANQWSPPTWEPVVLQATIPIE